MKTVQEWQKIISDAANKKYPNNASWTEHRRLHAVAEQYLDVRASIDVEKGFMQSTDHAHQDPNHRIAAAIADLLILAEMRGADMEAELQKVLEFFQKPVSDSKPN